MAIKIKREVNPAAAAYAGKQGRIAKAIRSVVKAAASKEDKKVVVEIMQ